MSSLRERLSIANEIGTKSLQERIRVLKEKKKILDETLQKIEEGYSTRAKAVTLHKKVKNTSLERVEELKKAEAEIASIFIEFKDTLAEKGITSVEDLLSSPGHQEDEEILRHRSSKEGVSSAKKEEETARGSIKESASALRATKKTATEFIPEEDGDQAFSNQSRENTLNKLKELSLRFETQIKDLEAKTPEREEEKKQVERQVKDRFADSLSERFGKQKFLKKGFWQDRDMVLVEDLSASEKFGEAFVLETIRNKAGERLRVEVEELKEKAGIVTAKKELARLKELPQKHTELVQKVEGLVRKREHVIRALTDKDTETQGLIKARVGLYFHEIRDLDLKDFARFWLYKREKDFVWDSFYRGQNEQNQDLINGGVPVIFSDFLARRANIIRTIGQAGTTIRKAESPSTQGDLPDLDDFEKKVQEYENFLDTYLDIVENHSESIAKSSTAREKGDKDDIEILREGELMINHGQLSKDLQLSSRVVRAGLQSGKTFADIERDIASLEEPFGKIYDERMRHINVSIDKDWAERKYENFRRDNPDVVNLKNRKHKLKEVVDLSLLLEEELLSIKRLVGEDNPENLYSKFRVIVTPDRGHKTSVSVWHPEEDKFDRQVRQASDSVRRAEYDVDENSRKKRPMFSFGKPKLDVELELLKEKLKAENAVLNQSKKEKESFSSRQERLTSTLNRIVSLLESNRIFRDEQFDLSKNMNAGVFEFSNKVQSVIERARHVRLTNDEEAVLLTLSELEANADNKRRIADENPQQFTDVVRGALIERGLGELL